MQDVVVITVDLNGEVIDICLHSLLFVAILLGDCFYYMFCRFLYIVLTVEGDQTNFNRYFGFLLLHNSCFSILLLILYFLKIKKKGKKVYFYYISIYFIFIFVLEEC